MLSSILVLYQVRYPSHHLEITTTISGHLHNEFGRENIVIIGI